MLLTPVLNILNTVTIEVCVQCFPESVTRIYLDKSISGAGKGSPISIILKAVKEAQLVAAIFCFSYVFNFQLPLNKRTH